MPKDAPPDSARERAQDSAQERAEDSTNELTLEDGKSANRRKSPRVPIRVWAENRGFEEFCIWLRAEDIKHDFAFCYRTSDLSAEGIFLETSTPLKAGTEMDLTFRLPESGRSIHAFGEVVRTVDRGGPGAPGMAVIFHQIAAEDRAVLEAFLLAHTLSHT